MRSIQGWKRWARWATMVGAAAVAVLQLMTVPAFAGFELPPGERITNLPAIPRNMPQKEAYELYDPVIGRNFDIKNLWMRADLRVRPEMRNNTCFGGAILAGGACNTFGGANARGAAPNSGATAGNKGNDFFVQQWIRLGIGYDLSPDVNFYMEIIDSATWGGNGNALNAGNGGDPLNHNCSSTANGACRLGVRAAYMLVRNLAGVQGLSMKVGRQYVIFGNHSLFGHFDWANTGYSHDGVMFAYQTKTFDSYFGWFRNSETDIAQAAPVGSGGPNIAGTSGRDANRDADMFIFYNQYKAIPGFVIEPYYVYYKNNLGSADNAAQGLGTAKHSNQTRHMVGGRVEMRKGGWDFSSETAWQFGQMGQVGACSGEQKCLHINAWATRNWVGYTAYDWKWKPRLAFNFDYASGDSRNNTCGATPGSCSTANTFENFFPTNHIHMGYMDVQAWKNMLSPSVNFQARPSARDHIEIWYTNLNLANSKDCWYRGAQGCYVFSNATNTKKHVGDEIDVTWTRMFADGKVALQATYGTLFAGGYLTSTLNQQVNQHWAYVSLWMNF
ncbi:alginate export family protein [Nitrospira sp. Nam80]